MTERRRRLIEVAFPLEEVSAHSRREKNVRHGHISTLHIWWARRPLAACRAFIYASLVDDPGDDRERDELLKEVADLASWDAVRKPELIVRQKADGGSGLTGHKLLERARQRILDCNGGKPPRLLDPFAGGGAIPLEALRLGCDVEASDLNPVAVLILKGTVEYPQKYGRPLAEQREQLARGERDSIAGVNGQVPEYIREAGRKSGSAFGEADAVAAFEKNPLAADVRFWGNWMLERAREELAEFYPPDPDGSVPVAYLWSRTVPCPNCKAEMPLIRQYWLNRGEGKEVALWPDVDPVSKSVRFTIVEGINISGNPAEATTSRGDTVCLVCRQAVKAAYVHEAGRRGELGSGLTATVLQGGRGGKRFRPVEERDNLHYDRAKQRHDELKGSVLDDIPVLPDEPLAFHPQYMLVREYGLDVWSKLFNSRQLVSLARFTSLVRESHEELLRYGVAPGYADAVVTYLGLSVDRLADSNSTLATWVSSGAFTSHTFTRQALPMVWDYSEACLLQDTAGGFPGAIGWIAQIIEAEAFAPIGSAHVTLRDARQASGETYEACITDPPYYDAINYADLSDFFIRLAETLTRWDSQ